MHLGAMDTMKNNTRQFNGEGVCEIVYREWLVYLE